MTRQLLAFSRQQSLAPQVFDLNDALTRLFPMLRRLIREDVEIVLEFEAGVALVNMDRSQLEQVLINLSTNARDAMPFGGTLTIRTAPILVGDIDERLPGLLPGQEHLPDGPGHRRGHASRCPGANLRAVLHDQSVGGRYRARLGDHPRYRQAERRVYLRAQRAWPGDDLRNILAWRSITWAGRRSRQRDIPQR